MKEIDVSANPFAFLARGLNRRAFLLGAASVAALTTAVGMTPALAQRRGDRGLDEVSVEALMKPGALPDIVVGKADAPVTIVEYASMTCGHCANFHNNVFPALKEKYIDTGKVRLVMREFPLDNLAAAAAMLARCAGGDATVAMISALFKTQDKWAFVRGNPVPELFKIAQQAGFSQERFDTCLKDNATLDQMISARQRASDEFGVNATPTFFINGKRLRGRSDTIEAFDQALAPFLGG
ncbi:thioredoxin domain-containing protein [Hyphomicrobium sp. CS1BSMeth3]|uniref:thioredoxin domain-containing protein n=1 Tax=Hyphomicrobium sp. CS1BSMeth3 TaxID=1892844 RepID=UPI001FCDF6C6|nr:thioredoxin domain-containing protein [Hyphomicrobium sp. CS1BSMeth3]